MSSAKQSSNSFNGVILQSENVRKSFVNRGKRTDVLKGVNISVNAGEIVVISGKSGAGKSTFLHILAGLDRPTAGTVTFNGTPLQSLSKSMLARMRREHMGIIFQHSNLLSSWTALENVEAALYHRPRSRKIRRQHAMTLLENFGLGNRCRHLPAELSAGEQQRVAVARALINDPDIILADEPTGDVDPQTAEEILDILVSRVRTTGASLVLVTHGTSLPGVADHLLTLKNGVISCFIENNSKEEIIQYE